MDLGIRSIQDLKIAGKRVFIRVDFNVPLSEPDSEGVRRVEEDNRIQEALPTIRFAIESGAKVVLASHLGRPKAKPTPEFSLEPVALRLAELLGQDVTLMEDCVGEGIGLMVSGMKNGQVTLLENLRFHPGEEKDDSSFAAELSRFTDVFVMDAFGAAHRAHASTHALPAMVRERAMGFLMEKEIENLSRLLQDPPKPFFLLLGGSKVADKIKTVQNLMQNVQGIAIGGAMAFSFLAADGKALPRGAKTPSTEEVEAAGNILRLAKRRGIEIHLPQDFVESFDIGPNSTEDFKKFLTSARAVFWNGPMGWFEKPPYDLATNEIAKALSKIQALKIVGGGDTVSAVKKGGFEKGFDHLSTGGGAALEFLEGHSLPGIDVLRGPAP